MKQGLAIEIPPKDDYWGRSAYLRDADGHQAEITKQSDTTTQAIGILGSRERSTQHFRAGWLSAPTGRFDRDISSRVIEQ